MRETNQPIALDNSASSDVVPPALSSSVREREDMKCPNRAGHVWKFDAMTQAATERTRSAIRTPSHIWKVIHPFWTFQVNLHEKLLFVQLNTWPAYMLPFVGHFVWFIKRSVQEHFCQKNSKIVNNYSFWIPGAADRARRGLLERTLDAEAAEEVSTRSGDLFLHSRKPWEGLFGTLIW